MLLSCLLYPVGPAAIILMPMIVGGLIDSHGFSEQQAGNIAALEGLGLVFASMLAAAWIRRVSWVKALLVAFLAYAALNILSANIEAYVPLLVLRCLSGLAGGSVMAVTVAALGDQREPDRAFGLAQAVQGVMMLGGFLAAPWLVQRWGVSAIYYMLAGASLLMTLTLPRFPVAGRVRAAATRENALQAGHTGLIWLGLFASVLFFVNVFGFWAFVERIGQAGGLPAQTIALALGISQVVAIAGALAAAWASDRYGRYLPLLIVFIRSGRRPVRGARRFWRSNILCQYRAVPGAVHHRRVLPDGRHRPTRHPWPLSGHHDGGAGPRLGARAGARRNFDPRGWRLQPDHADGGPALPVWHVDVPVYRVAQRPDGGHEGRLMAYIPAVDTAMRLFTRARVPSAPVCCTLPRRRSLDGHLRHL
jgi:MFS family permease